MSSDPEPACDLAFCGWRGKMSVRCFVPRFERAHGLRLFGQDLAQIQAEVAKMKADREEKHTSEGASSSSATDPANNDAPDQDENDNMPALEAEDEDMKGEKDMEEKEKKTDEEALEQAGGENDELKDQDEKMETAEMVKE